MIVRRGRVALFLATAVCGTGMSAIAHSDPPLAVEPSGQSLERQFENPPHSARPRVWWHWMNGNITEDGIKKDIEWMVRAGIGGLHHFDANLDTPQIVEKRLPYMTPDWQKAFRFAAIAAQKSGLELGIASSPGWSETGGPWVAPEDGLKKLSWSAVIVEGGGKGALKLIAPINTVGRYADLPVEEGAEFSPKTVAPALYKDIAVLAYRVSGASLLPVPRYRGSDGEPIDADALADDSLTTMAVLEGGTPENPPTIAINFTSAQTVRSMTLYVPGISPTPRGLGLLPRLESSADGQNWSKVLDAPPSIVPSTVSFPPVKAAHFRVVFASRPSPASRAGSMPGKLEVRQLRLTGESRVHMFEAKAGFATVQDFYDIDSGADTATKGIAFADLVNLTDRVRQDGTIAWRAPKGTWRIIRLGWTLTGKANHPASPDATGLEVDKMDPAATRRYMEHYLGTYRAAVGPELIGKAGVQAFLNDSTEVGPFNWTPAMFSEFRRLRGYDLAPWLPALTGAIVGTRQQSDAFLYDFRRTIADLHTSAHYGTVAQVAHEHGLRVYGEALENFRSTLGDDMAMRSFADYPMAAMWYVPQSAKMPGAFVADVKGAASVAHVYGRNIVAAESLTSIMMPWATGPRELKHVIDHEFALGINRPVIHTSVHQPVDDKVPGLSLGIFGQYFNRHEAWAEMARPWMDYIARSALMLQQGRNVADVAYFYGEEAPLVSQYADGLPTEVPSQFAYDFVNVDALARLFSVDGNDLVTRTGGRYRVLYLGGSSRFMTLPVLQRISELVEQGATVVGNAPTASPSLADDPARFRSLVTKLWSGREVTPWGKGQVVAGTDLAAALSAKAVAPDFDFTSSAPDSQFLFQHRKLEDGHVYYVLNRRDRAEKIEARFRVTGKMPEIWRATTGKAEIVSYKIENGKTVVPLVLDAEDAVFVVFRKPATDAVKVVEPLTLAPVATLDGSWKITFQQNRGAPTSIVWDKLTSLSESADPAVRYFSGVAAYTTEFRVPATWRPGHKMWIDLGDLRDVGEVAINGRTAGSLWHAPYRIEIGQFLHGGRNTIQVKVANLWVNRLIGDQQSDAQKVAWTSFQAYSKGSKPRLSGLLGPVTLQGKSAVK